MAIDSTLAYLTARGATLPPGQSSRLLQFPNSRRYAVKFDGAATQYAEWTVPDFGSTYQGTGTVTLVVEAFYAGTSGAVKLDVSVEAVTPGDSDDLTTASSYGATSSVTQSVPGTADTLFAVS